MRAPRMPRTGRFKLDGEPQPQQAAVVMIAGKVARMTAYLGSTFPDQLIQEPKSVQTGQSGMRCGSAERRVPLGAGGQAQFQVSTTPTRPARVKSLLALRICLHDVDSIGQSNSGMSNGMRRLPADVTCLPLAGVPHPLYLQSRIVHAALDCLLIYPHICRIPQIRMTSARHRVGRYAARWDEWLFLDRPLIGQCAQNILMLATPSTMAVPRLLGPAVSRVDGVNWWTISLVSLYFGCN